MNNNRFAYLKVTSKELNLLLDALDDYRLICFKKGNKEREVEAGYLQLDLSIIYDKRFR